MARLGCYCGNTLSNVECPSKDIIRVFFKEKVDTLLKENSKLELWDVYSEEEEYDFWHCDQCGRIYACPIPGQNVKYVCNPIEIHEDDEFNIDKCIEMFVYNDTLLDATIENSFHILWKDFYQRNTDKRYFLSMDNKKIWVTNVESKSVIESYAVEEVTTDEKEFDK